MKIEVTKTDIKRGKPWVAQECPIALAVKRATGETDVRVRRGLMAIEIGLKKRRLTAACLVFAEDFDYGRPVEPFSFSMQWKHG